jgi:predicted transcriptional regulator
MPLQDSHKPEYHTVRLRADAWRQLKILAAQVGRTMTDLMDEAIAWLLSRYRPEKP